MYIFISYAKDEGKKYADMLDQILQRDNHKTFLFHRDTKNLKRPFTKIAFALHSCSEAIFLITEESHNSNEQDREYNVACSLNKGVALIKEGVDLHGYSMLSSNIFYRFDDSNVGEKMQHLLKSINRVPDSGKTSIVKEGGEIK